MAIKAYVGRMGSGKSYEVVSNVIVPALGRGRRVISNIAGLQYELIKEYLVSTGVHPDKVGQLLTVSHDVVSDPQFWMTDKDDLESRGENQIRPGDLVCLDEIWRFFEGFKKPPERVLNFFRMHRHMLDDSGLSSDVALVTQDVMDIGPAVRRVLEETYRMTKLTMVGQAKRYRIDIFSGAQGRNDKPLKSFFRTYDSKFFPFYSSHSMGSGKEAKEENIDQRGNILNDWRFKYGIPFGAVLLVLLVYFGFTSFSKLGDKKRVEEAMQQQSTEQPITEYANPDPPKLSSDRIQAFAQVGSQVFVITESSTIVQPPALKITTATVEAVGPDSVVHSFEVRKNVQGNSAGVPSIAGFGGS